MGLKPFLIFLVMICCSLVYPSNLVTLARVLLFIVPRSVVYLGGHFRTQPHKDRYFVRRCFKSLPWQSWRMDILIFKFFGISVLVFFQILSNKIVLYFFGYEFAPQWFCASASDIVPFLIFGIPLSSRPNDSARLPVILSLFLFLFY